MYGKLLEVYSACGEFGIVEVVVQQSANMVAVAVKLVVGFAEVAG